MFAGFAEKDTTPAIGKSVTVQYDPVTNQAFVSIFASYPFVDPTPPPPTFASLSGYARAGIRMKLKVNFESVQAVIADANGFFDLITFKLESTPQSNPN